MNKFSIKLKYKKITRIVDLIGAEINRVELQKAKLSNTTNTIAMNASMGEDKADPYFIDDKKRLDQELTLLNEMREDYERLLERIEIELSIGDNKEEVIN